MFISKRAKRWSIVIGCFVALILIFKITTDKSLSNADINITVTENNKENNPRLVITVKTSFKSHNTRVAQIVDTWFQFDPENVYFITDAFDPLLNLSVGGHLINTKCGSLHDEDSLGCKFNQELRVMVSKNATWSCHVDDDNYINLPVLNKLLGEFDPNIPYYLGRTSTKFPITKNGKTFWFATGGAGICLSNAALQKLAVSILNDDFYSKYIKYEKLSDDVGFGYMMNEFNLPMTEISNFLSHYDKLDAIPQKAIKEIAILSNHLPDKNFINLPYFFNPSDDPFKFQTLHCFLYNEKCNKKLKRLGVNVHTNSSSYNSYGTYVLLTTKP